MRKILKWSFKTLIGLILLTALFYGGFHIWEYTTGGKYIKYLSENSETIPLDSNFTYNALVKDIAQKQLILVGEIHGFDEPAKFDIDFFKFLHENHNVDHYIAELDFVQASLLNDFLVSGDEKSLEEILRKWVVVQGRNNKDYFNKYLKLHQYYQQLPEDDKFEFIGIERLQDGDLLKNYLAELYPKTNSEEKDVLKNNSIGALLEELSDL